MVQGVPVGPPAGDDGVEFVQLRERDGRVEFAHAVVDGEGCGIAARVRPAVVAFIRKEFGGPRDGVVVRDEHAGVAGGDVLVIVQREATDIAQDAAEPSVVLGQVTLGTIFDQPEIVFAGEGRQRIHSAGRAGDMHGEDSRGLRTYAGFDRCRVQGVVRGIHIGKDRNGAAEQDGRTGAHVGQGGGDDFVAGLDAAGGQADMQRRRAAGAGHAMLGAVAGREACLEFAGLLAVHVKEGLLVEGLGQLPLLFVAEAQAFAVRRGLGLRAPV